MASEQSKPKGTQGVALGDIPDGSLIGGHVGDSAVLSLFDRHPAHRAQ
jgi:hypothetical protein